MMFRVARGDGAIIAGPYPLDTLKTFALTDIPAAGTHAYYIQVYEPTPTTQTVEAHLIGMVVKR